MADGMSNEKLRSYGLEFDEEAQVEEEESEEVESEELDEDDDEEVVASTEDEELDEEDEESEEDLDEDEQIEEDKKALALKEKLEKEKEEKRKFQALYDSEKARSDNVNAQIQQMYREIQQLKTQQESDELDDLGDDDDFVDVAKLKKVLKKDEKPNDEVKKIHATLQQINQSRSQWLSSQPDYKELDQYVVQKGYANDKNIASIPTDVIGFYYMAKYEKEAEARREEQKKYKRELKNFGKKKPGVPPTSGSGRPSKISKVDLTAFERQIESFGKKRGIDLSPTSKAG